MESVVSLDAADCIRQFADLICLEGIDYLGLEPCSFRLVSQNEFC